MGNFFSWFFGALRSTLPVPSISRRRGRRPGFRGRKPGLRDPIIHRGFGRVRLRERKRLVEDAQLLPVSKEKSAGVKSGKTILEPSRLGEDLHGPFMPLSEEEETIVRHALQDPDKFHLCKDEVLVVHENSNIKITRDIIRCLCQHSWLNDEVANIYFELLKERENRDPMKFLKCHFFNTFFYKKLTNGKNGYDFDSVRRWTTLKKLGYGLVECDKIFVPIHKAMHWCLAVIDVKNEKLYYLDSLGIRDEHALRILSRYYADEVKDKNNKIIDTTAWKYAAVDDLPRQKNGWDCGMFMLKFADFISRGLSLCFQQENMAYFRKRTVKEILKLRAE